jgi:hypothetical protein
MVEFDVAVDFSVEMADIFMVGECVEVTFQRFKLQKVLSAPASLYTVKPQCHTLIAESAFDVSQPSKEVSEFIFQLTVAAHFDRG